MIVQIKLHLRKCTSLVQCDVKIWFVDIFEEHEDRYMFCGEIHVHLIMEKHVMRYLKGTINYGPRYISNYEIIFAGIHRFKLGRKCHRLEKYIRMFL
jgi:hypothetical protein